MCRGCLERSVADVLTEDTATPTFVMSQDMPDTRTHGLWVRASFIWCVVGRPAWPATSTVSSALACRPEPDVIGQPTLQRGSTDTRGSRSVGAVRGQSAAAVRAGVPP